MLIMLYDYISQPFTYYFIKMTQILHFFSVLGNLQYYHKTNHLNKEMNSNPTRFFHEFNCFFPIKNCFFFHKLLQRQTLAYNIL